MDRTEDLDRPELSAAESLALIEQQRSRVDRDLDVNVALLYGAWGVAWTLGFASFYLIGSGEVDAPWWAAGLLNFGLLGAAIAVTSVHSARVARGVRGVSAEIGTMYGLAWTLGFVAMAAVNVGLTRLGLTDEQVAALWPAASLLVVGLLYLAGGALWRDRFQYGLGIWILVTDAVSVFAGVPGNYLVLSIAGGGGFLAAAAWFGVRRRRAVPA